MKVEDHVMFTAVHGDWKVGARLSEMDGPTVARFLSTVANTVNERIPGYLSEVMDISLIKGMAETTKSMELVEVFTFLKSPGTSRKLGGLVHENDKKLRKLLVDVAKALLVRESLGVKLGTAYPGGSLERLEIDPPFDGEHVNFTAKDGRWIVVKRLMIDGSVQGVDVARLLASINETVTLKLPAYAGIDVEGIEEWFSDFKKVKKSEIPSLVKRFEEFSPEEYAPEEFAPHARIYALRAALSRMGLSLDVPAKNLEKYIEKK